jgi:hypothetical protein
MDPRSVALLDQLIANHIERLRTALPAGEPEPGRETVRLVSRLLDRFESERSKIVAEIEAAPDNERQYLARGLERLFIDLRIFQPHLTPFVRDAGRTSNPLGLMIVVESLIATLLPNGADPVLHFEEQHQYATMDLARSLRNLWLQLPNGQDDRDDLWDWDSSPPVVFFVPDIDPDNAMLLPILAHEVGHQAIWQSDLGSQVMTGCADNLQPLFDTALASDTDLDPYTLRRQLMLWIDEMLSDALATILCGPSFLFSAAAFLPAPAMGSPESSHPFSNERIALTLRLLDEVGWTHVLDDRVPDVTNWLRGISTRFHRTGSARETFLLSAIDVVTPHIVGIAKKHVSGAALDPQHFEGLYPELQVLLGKGIPPAQVGEQPVQQWEAVLAGWLQQIAVNGDNPRSIAIAAQNQLTNERVLKAVELARIVQLWNEEGATDARK